MLINAVASRTRRQSVWETSHISWSSISGRCAADHRSSIIDEPLIIVVLSLVLVSHPLWSASELRQIEISDMSEVVTAVPALFLRTLHKAFDEHIDSGIDVLHITWISDNIEVLDAVELNYLLSG